MPKTKISQFNDIEELNIWIIEKFGFDPENPLKQLLEDYISAKEFLYGIYALIDKRERGNDLDSMTKKPIVCKRLKGLMVEHEITVRQLSEKIGISENTLILKINDQDDWLYQEMVAIMKHFGFSEVKDVFPEIYDHVLKE